MASVMFTPDEEEAMILPEDWGAVLSEALSTPQWSRLMKFVDRERQQGTVYPPPDAVFRALESTPYKDVRVVILGQDPYHGPGQAHGLCFSVARGHIHRHCARSSPNSKTTSSVSLPGAAT
jgi:uracil DNA glycosylase